MFLTQTQHRNPALIEAAQELHAHGRIEPDTYVLDLDVVSANARALADTAARHQVRPWFVTKQLGRVGLLTAAVAQAIPAATAIDVREARAVTAAGARLGNVGHLVQVPRRALPAILAADPAHVTVFDRANLRAVSAAAADLGRTQPVLLRIAGDPATTYPGQEGGIEPEDVPAVLDLAAALPHVRVAGVTGFPCLLFNPVTGKVQPTNTTDRVLRGADHLRSAGIDPLIDLPSHSSCSTIPMVARLGGTHVEPGHALTGTTPEHAARDDLPELPGMVYVSEIAQTLPGPAIFGGGFYPRGHARDVLVGAEGDSRLATLVDSPAENIDYYRRLRLPDGTAPAELGEVAVMAFRTQIFVTRSHVAVVAGVQAGEPDLLGLFDSGGRPLPEGAR